jgi:serine protease AprX
VPGTARPLIVQAMNARVAGEAVVAVGGRVTRTLPIVDGVAATVPAAEVRALAGSPGVKAVTPDAEMHVQSVPVQAPAALATDPVSVYGDEVRAGPVRAKGWAGQGVTVALLDTGISGEDLAGRVKPVTDDLTGVTSPCKNLSGEATCRDTYGHGTFMAGIIAGNGAASGGRYTGIAPRASLVSIKVGSADGSSDVSNVLAGIQWAVSFRTRYHIDVLNLSLGTDSTQSWKVDPLNYAVERAWAAGITVVVSASNRGPAAGTISKPADDPWVITVGAVDDLQTTKVSDDVSPDFSGRGPARDGVAKPDLSAPGAHLVSLRSVGSTIDNQYPQRIAGAYHQGSGTSQAAAVVSGVAALLLSADPSMAPNRVKYALTSTARRAASTDPSAVGRGVVDAYGALTASRGQANSGLAHSNPSVLQANLDPTRGTVRVQTSTHVPIQGTQTAQLLTWDPAGYLTGDWSSSTWYLGPWALQPIYSTVWYGNTWAGMDTNGCSPDAGPAGDCLYGGHNWEGSVWYGAWD